MIYFDNSATTKIAPAVLQTYQQVSEKIWGNPSSLHDFGEQAHQLLQQARAQIFDQLHLHAGQVYFTSGGTEGDNWIIKGTALAKASFGRHIITTQVEHAAVLESMHRLEQFGFEVTYLPVDKTGRIRPADLQAALRSDTILVSIMAVNNEMGAVQPLLSVAKILQQYPKVHFHVDAVQALGKQLDQVVFNDRLDFATFSGHKFHAPRGVGFIYARNGRTLVPLLDGGGQEMGQRSGTENLPAIAALSKAVRLLKTNEAVKVTQQQAIRTCIYRHLQTFSKVVLISGLSDEFAPHILCFAIRGVKGETVVHALEEQGIYLSTTSACSSKKGLPSTTLAAMHLDPDVINGAVRISLSDQNELEEAHQFNRVFDGLYQRFAALS
ncbi:cysteine desulfurase family protein [Fructilactobacillus florum]|uniref:Cysteine desulfurase n=1 Tax=Fructilactobacillus florum DSM 22689 = JCM 16035 TaxID=1423745 RepID=A0A0R2CLG5_9LACO|nr:cysteine desulfurase family protein [Fructilactobacillus florum]KRM92440.1 cysteine desulfurase [Fructilactobacillus florum DSM 22689 = JCM 16035]